MTFEETGTDLNTLIDIEGCYIVSDGLNLVVCWTCLEDSPMVVNVDGDCMFISYARGSISLLLQHTKTIGIKYIMFERNGDGKIKKYDFLRFYNRCK